MEKSNSSSNSDFLSILKSIKSSNPFDNINPSNNMLDYSDYNFFGFPEDFYDFEIKCPICFGRVTNARRPENCFHIFCSLCIEEWLNQSKKCPCCRKGFKKILKVSYSESWVSEKYA